MPGNAEPSIVDSVLEKAAKREDITLNGSELREIASKESGIVEKAKIKLQTKDQLRHLTKEIREAAEVSDATSETEDIRASLDGIAEEIEAHASSVQDAVSIETPPEPGEAKTLVEKVKNVLNGVGSSTVGMLVRGWISLQRTLMSLGVMEGSPQQLDAIEKLYGKFFGAGETVEKSAALLKGAGINVVKDKKDSNAYFELKKEYLTKLNGRMQGKSPELQSMEKEQYTFDAYLAEKTGEYAASHAGKNGDTTLTGILKNQRPAESANKNN